MANENVTATLPPEYGNSSGLYLRALENQGALEILPTLIVLGVLAVVGVTGNILTLYVYYFRFNRSSTRTYVLSMSVFDLLFCAISLPLEIVDLRFSHTYDASWLCRMHRFMVVFFSLGSGFTLVAVALVRRRKVCHPFRKQITSKNINRSVVLCIAMSVAIAVPFGVMNGHHSVPTAVPGVVGSACSVDDAYLHTLFPIVYNALLALVFIACVVSMVTAYVQIAYKIVRHNRKSANSGGTLTGFAMALRKAEGLGESSTSGKGGGGRKGRGRVSGEDSSSSSSRPRAAPSKHRPERQTSSRGDDTSHVEEQSQYDDEFHEEVKGHSSNPEAAGHSSKPAATGDSSKPAATGNSSKAEAAGNSSRPDSTRHSSKTYKRKSALSGFLTGGGGHKDDLPPLDKTKVERAQQKIVEACSQGVMENCATRRHNDGQNPQAGTSQDEENECSSNKEKKETKGETSAINPHRENFDPDTNKKGMNNNNSKSDDDEVFLSNRKRNGSSSESSDSTSTTGVMPKEVPALSLKHGDKSMDNQAYTSQLNNPGEESMDNEDFNSHLDKPVNLVVRSFSLQRREAELDMAMRTLVHAASDDVLNARDTHRHKELLVPAAGNLKRRSLSAGDQSRTDGRRDGGTDGRRDGGADGQSRSPSHGDNFFHVSEISDFVKDHRESRGKNVTDADVIAAAASRENENVTDTSTRPEEDDEDEVSKTSASRHPARLVSITFKTDDEVLGQDRPISSSSQQTSKEDGRNEKSGPDRAFSSSQETSKDGKNGKRGPDRAFSSSQQTSKDDGRKEKPGPDRAFSSSSQPSTTSGHATRLLSDSSQADDGGPNHHTRLYSTTSVSSRSERLHSVVQRTLRRLKSATLSEGEGDDAGMTSSLRRRTSRKQIPSRTTYMMFVLAAIFVISYLPYLAINGVRAAVQDIETGLHGWKLNLYTLTLKCYFINAVVNPIVYSFCSARFRHQCRHLCDSKKYSPPRSS